MDDRFDRHPLTTHLRRHSFVSRAGKRAQSRLRSGWRWKLAGTSLNEYVVIRYADDVLRIVTPRPLAASATGEHAWIEVGTGVEDSL
jgi:hypothetical protein